MSSSKLKKVKSTEFSVQTEPRDERLVLTEAKEDLKEPNMEKEERMLFTEHIEPETTKS